MAGREFLVIGHRGARGHAPENTLLAFDTGIALGAPWVELDVQLHRASGELPVIHDLSVDRTTNGRGYVEDLGWPALRQLDAGKGQRIPTLGEVLELVDQRAGINVELKTWDGTAAAVAPVLRAAIAAGWPADQFLVSSFHLPELYEFHELAPEIPVGVLLAGVPLDWAGAASELGATHLNISAEFADARLIADAHTRGLKVLAYTVNEPGDFTRLRRLGVDGVFTDFPDRALSTSGLARG